MKFIAIFSFTLISFWNFAQPITKEYVHQKQIFNNVDVKVFTGPDTISLSEYQPIEHHVKEKKVDYKGGHLMLRWEQDLKKAYLLTTTGEKKAIISFEDDTYFDVMVDSNLFVWESKEVTSWKYTLNGKAVMSCKISKPNGKHILKITIHDASVNGLDLLEVISAHLAIVRFHKQTQAQITALMIPLALMRTALYFLLPSD